LFGPGTPDSLRSLGVAPEFEDGDGGESTLAQERWGLVGAGEEEIAQDGERFDEGVFEEVVEAGECGGHEGEDGVGLRGVERCPVFVRADCARGADMR